jgi:hypothetical protein
MNQPIEEIEWLLRDGGVDGIELIGELPWEENLRSLVRFSEIDSQTKLPILGNSDTHSPTHTYGGYWTLVFARSNRPSDIMAAILSKFSVACMLMPMSPPNYPIAPRLVAFGPFELVDLAIFLQTYFFPRHDALCNQEAELGRRFLAGDVHRESAVQEVQVALEGYYAQSFGVAARSRLTGENL